MLDAFTGGGAQIGGGRVSNDFELAADVDYATAATRRGSGSCSRAGAIAATKSANCRRHVHVREPRCLRGRPAEHFHAAHRRPSGQLLERRSSDGTRRTTSGVARSLSLSVGCGRSCRRTSRRRLQPGAAPGCDLVAVQERRDDAPRRRRHLLRLVRRRDLRADAAGRRRRSRPTSPSSNPGIPIRSPAATSAVLPSGRIVQAPDLVQPAHRENQHGGRADVRQVHAGQCPLRLCSQPHCPARPRHQRAARRRQRPDPASGTVTQVESTARLAEPHAAHRPQREPAVAPHLPVRRTTRSARAMNESDSPFSLPADNLRPARRVGAVAIRRAPPAVAACST